MTAAGVSRTGQQGEVAAAFDAQACCYDESWTGSVVGRLQREAVWREFDRLLGPRQRLLDLGCGTGADALHFARSGIRVHAVDISPSMLAVARKMAEAEGLTNLVSFELCALEDLARVRDRAPFDGAISNFGAINCVEYLHPLASTMAELLRSGAPLALCYMGRFCLWETIWYLSRGQTGKAFRRSAIADLISGGRSSSRYPQAKRASLGPDHWFQVYYPSVEHVVAAFTRHFRLVSFVGIGVLIPPSYMDSVAKSFPGITRILRFSERVICRWPVLRAMGDHRLLVFVRR